MTRKIHCAGCKIDLGEIRDASLRKGIVYQCNVCGSKKTRSNNLHHNAPITEIDNLFKTIFNNSKG